MRKASVVAVALVMAVSASAYARPQNFNPFQSSVAAGAVNGATPRIAPPYTVGFEAAGEPSGNWSLGTVEPQNGWNASGVNQPYETIETGHPKSGTQNMKLTFDTNFSGGTNRLVRSPDFSPVLGSTPGQRYNISQDMQVGALSGGADYHLTPGFITTSGAFGFTGSLYLWNGDYNGDYVYGDIFIVDDPNCDGVNLTVPVIGQWNPGHYDNITLDMTTPGPGNTCGTIAYYLNDPLKLGQPAYVGHFPFALSAGQSIVQEWGVLSDNFQVAGTGDDLYVDNIAVTSKIPEPATLALLGLGALSLIRRRR